MQVASRQFETIIPHSVKSHIDEIVRAKLGDQVVSVRVGKVELSGDELSVTIEITLRKAARESRKAPSFFGLTSKVRSAMGSLGQDVFPVLRPVAIDA